MKKYVKPLLIFESFEMNQRIASCDYDSKGTSGSVETCSFTDDDYGITIFNVGPNSPCEAQGEAYCYHTDEGGLNLFNS